MHRCKDNADHEPASLPVEPDEGPVPAGDPEDPDVRPRLNPVCEIVQTFLGLDPSVEPFAKPLKTTAAPKTPTAATKAHMAAPMAPSVAKDAIALLKSDHEAVSHLFAEFEKTRSIANKKALVADSCSALSVHAHAHNRRI